MYDFFKEHSKDEGIEKMGEHITDISTKEEISIAPEPELRQEPDTHQSQNELGKYKFYTEIGKEEDEDMGKWNRAETKKEQKVEKHKKSQLGPSTLPMGTTGIYSSVQRGRFEQEFYGQEHKVDTEEFLEETYFIDKLSFIPNGIFLGKKLTSSIRDCKIYLRKGRDIYTYNLDNSDKTRPFNKIPQNVMFIIIGDADRIFIAVGAEGEKKSIYCLPEDVVVAVYIETVLYKRLNHFYAYAVKGEIQNACNVDADPRIGRDMFRIFATIIESDLERSGLGQ